MAKRKQRETTRRVPKRWVRPLPLALATSALVGLGLSYTLLDPRLPQSESDSIACNYQPARSKPAVPGSAVSAQRIPQRSARHRPTRVTARTVDASSTDDVATLSSWSRDSTLAAHSRLDCLRRMEGLAPDQAVSLAAELARDGNGLIRSRAIAALAVNAAAPVASKALSQLRGRDAEIAMKLAPKTSPKEVK